MAVYDLPHDFPAITAPIPTPAAVDPPALLTVDV
jgi:hypothetical protein